MKQEYTVTVQIKAKSDTLTADELRKEVQQIVNQTKYGSPYPFGVRGSKFNIFFTFGTKLTDLQ